jgi:guanosine-3',5'-bis(diphosphate) 3'-pyrophosphohydrolase
MVSSHVQTYDSLVEHVRSAQIPCDTERLHKAWVLAQEAYAGKTHWTGVPVIEHVMGMLAVLLPYQPDEDAIVASLLHHFLDVKYWNLNDIEENFGPKVRELVSGVHLLSHVTLRDRRSSVGDLRLMLLTVSDDIRTVLLTLCDRLFLLDASTNLSKEERTRIAQDVLQLFAPVAARLGIYNLKHALESQAFPIVYPDDATQIDEQLAQVQERIGSFLKQSAKSLEDSLKEQGITVRVEMREKQAYSIFRKMKDKSLSHVSDLYDLFAMRVIVQTEAECYQVLGLLHKIGRPVANRFKDYIAFPKPNGYQSLHTTLAKLPGMEDESLFVEVQVRTEQMHIDAQYGVAAHWMYKEGDSHTARATQQVQLQNVLATQQSLEGEEADALADHIFVLTPRGDVIELPEGATPLDFAFQVHTDLGLSFRSARVNGGIVSLDYSLENGDVIEILKRKTPEPSPQWMQLLRMASSRSKLKRFLYAQDRPRLIARGKELVNEELRKHRLQQLDTALSILRQCDGEILSVQQREDILMKIGQGSERAQALLPRLELLKGKIEPITNERIGNEAAVHIKKIEPEFEVEGEVPLPTRCAKCCKPQEWPRGPLRGVVGRGGIVVIHRKDCGMLRHANPDRILRAWWFGSREESATL